MKVELGGLTAIQGAVDRGAKQVSTAPVAGGQSVGEDRTTFHSGSMQELVGKALATPEVRQDKIDAARQAISNGEYEIDPARIASAIIAEDRE